jgi:hypothetical protein
MSDSSAVIPPGYSVVVISPSSRPGFARTQSGPWILEFGAPRFIAPALENLESFLRSATERTSIIWLVSGDILAAFPDPAPLVEAARERQALSSIVSHLAVFPDDTPTRLAAMRGFHRIGFGVHYGGPARECYVEVHRPDGTIVVGMPGAAFIDEG